MDQDGRFVKPDEHTDVAVVIVTYNSVQHVGALLEDLRRDARDLAMRVIIVDNDSYDGTVDRVSAEDDVVVICSGGNIGYAGGINCARPHIGDCNAVLILNPDLRVEQGAISVMMAALERPGVGAVVPLNVLGDGAAHDWTLRREPTILRALGDALVGGRRLAGRPDWLSETDVKPQSYRTPHAIDWATGAAVLIKADVERSVGDWDESFFLYSEETDYFRRIRETGHLVWFEPAAVVIHAGGGSGTSYTLQALQTVNRIRYVQARHSKPYGAVFRSVAVLTEISRIHRPAHRATLPYVLNKRRWSDLPKASFASER